MYLQTTWSSHNKLDCHDTKKNNVNSNVISSKIILAHQPACIDFPSEKVENMNTCH